MSFLPEFLPEAAPPPEPVVAAAVIIWREGPAGREIFWVRRGEPLRFAGGFHAFPGGRLDPADAEVPVGGATREAAALVACACRELFEETGILLARGAETVGPAARRDARRALLDDRIGFGEILSRHRLALDAALLEPAGRWITPPHLPLRYDARLFLVRFPPAEEATVWPGELASGEFVLASRALALWESGEVLLHPPNLWGISCLARAAPPACLAPLRNPPHCERFVTSRIEFQRGLWLTAVRTPTLPPATHTNAYLVDLGGGGLAVVDPGSADPGEQRALEEMIDTLATEGLTPREVWLTHHHPDHVGGVARLRERFRVPVMAHPETGARLPASAGPIASIADGVVLHGRFLAIHTPGHAPGHLAFLDRRTRALLCGDMVSTLSTIVIDPPEGDMAAYLASLERLRALGPRTLYPAHGPPAPNAPAKLEATIAHRYERETKVLVALPGTLTEVTARAYDDTPSPMLPLAERSCLASLEKLRAEGRARLDAARWST